MRGGMAAAKHGSCAVVGNGGSLLLYRLGHVVDAHDVVIRLNAGPTAGFEEHVGTRTTYRLVNRLHMGFREGNEVVLQHVSTAESLAQFLKGAGNALINRRYIIDMSFHEWAYNFTDKGVLSNGFYAVSPRDRRREGDGAGGLTEERKPKGAAGLPDLRRRHAVRLPPQLARERPVSPGGARRGTWDMRAED